MVGPIFCILCRSAWLLVSVTQRPVKFRASQGPHTPLPIVTLRTVAFIFEFSRSKFVGVPRNVDCVKRTTYQREVSGPGVGGGGNPLGPIGRTDRIIRFMLNELRSGVFVFSVKQ